MQLSQEDRRRAYAWWLRTGWLPRIVADGAERKFNPYHDPQNGEFTFAPGGVGGATGYTRSASAGATSKASGLGDAHPGRNSASERLTSQAAARTGLQTASLTAGPESEPDARGGNIRAFEDPMTLEQAFPGLSHAPGGAIVAAADNLLDLTGPANATTSALADNWKLQLINDIKSVDPNWYFQELGPVDTIQGKINELNDLRWQRAVTYLRIKGDSGPLQIETLRFIQGRADIAYDEGLKLLSEGRLNTRLSDQEALGNFVDMDVRKALRDRYRLWGIESTDANPVRVNRRENNTSGSEPTYRLPDARIGDTAFDVTLTRKTLSTRQVRGFFNTDFQPRHVVIIRPRQLGRHHTYVISRPGTKR